MLLSQRSSTPFKSPSVKVPRMIWPGIDTILENVYSPLNSTKKNHAGKGWILKTMTMVLIKTKK
jgi:hypothetical protein